MASAMFLSLQVGLASGALLLLVGVPLGWLLARWSFPGKLALETAVSVPLVLPPTVVGYYLLLLIGRGGPLVEWFGLELVFTRAAIVLAASIMGMPFMVQAARAGFASVDVRLENAARTLGCSEWSVFWRISLPLARRTLLAGFILGLLRALGEFGASLMVAGNIPGRTQTMPLAIYDAVYRGEFTTANILTAVLTLAALFGLWSARRLESPVPIGRRR
jgi:molybdate transport system permease protein